MQIGFIEWSGDGAAVEVTYDLSAHPVRVSEFYRVSFFAAPYGKPERVPANGTALHARMTPSGTCWDFSGGWAVLESTPFAVVKVSVPKPFGRRWRWVVDAYGIGEWVKRAPGQLLAEVA